MMRLKRDFVDIGETISLDNGNHVESIVLLSRKSPDSVINVKVEFGEGEDKVPLDAIAERAKKYRPKEKVEAITEAFKYFEVI